MTGRERLLQWIRRFTDQRRFSDKIGITESYLSQVLSGRRRPRLPILGRIEDETGIPIRSWLPPSNGASSRKASKIGKTAQVNAEKTNVAVG